MKTLALLCLVVLLTAQQSTNNVDAKAIENKTLILASDLTSATIIDSRKGKSIPYHRQLNW